MVALYGSQSSLSIHFPAYMKYYFTVLVDFCLEFRFSTTFLPIFLINLRHREMKLHFLLLRFFHPSADDLACILENQTSHDQKNKLPKSKYRLPQSATCDSPYSISTHDSVTGLPFCICAADYTLYVIRWSRGVPALARPVGVIVFAARAVDPLVCVRAEIVPLRLQ